MNLYSVTDSIYNTARSIPQGVHSTYSSVANATGTLVGKVAGCAKAVLSKADPIIRPTANFIATYSKQISGVALALAVVAAAYFIYNYVTKKEVVVVQEKEVVVQAEVAPVEVDVAAAASNENFINIDAAQLQALSKEQSA